MQINIQVASVWQSVIADFDGSFNPTTTLQDTWSYFGTPVYSSHPRGSFRDFRQRHFEYKSTPLYIAGAYAPSNQFKLWSEVPLH
jgi:hypothetical protein